MFRDVVSVPLNFVKRINHFGKLLATDGCTSTSQLGDFGMQGGDAVVQRDALADAVRVGASAARQTTWLGLHCGTDSLIRALPTSHCLDISRMVPLGPCRRGVNRLSE